MKKEKSHITIKILELIKAGGSLAVVIVDKDPEIEFIPTENMNCVDPANGSSEASLMRFLMFSSLATHMKCLERSMYLTLVSG